MTFQVSADSAARPIVASRQTGEAALRLPLNYIDQGFSGVEVIDASTGASYGEGFLLAYSAIRGLTPTKP